MFIDHHRGEYPIALMCRVLQVSRAGYYAWRRRPPSRRSCENRRLDLLIKASFRESHGSYGSPRICYDLKNQGHQFGRNRIAGRMRSNGLQARAAKRFRVLTTDSSHRYHVPTDLLDRDFVVEAPNRVWMADVTYIRVGGKWLYLAVVMDLFSRLAVGWELAPYQGALLSKQALGRALNRRRGMAPMIHHSDRGVEYANTDYQEILRSNGITCSMTRKGDCWGNAVMESFFSTLKTERTKKVRYRSEAQARADIADYIEGWYNTKRLHSALGYISPLNFEKRAAA